ncbi:MAG: hypothetical protein JXC85_01345 [Candidatus Aenigmarchaeota archaeon]|nr:hypothetical protein [Candidatus Aenigmarchaeota archaeon]
MDEVDIRKALLSPGAYDVRVTHEIKMIQTHISWVFLTGEYAYKMKKPVDFGFLDFTTLEKRKRYCDLELELNKPLSPEIYLEVLPVTNDDGKIRIGGKGKVVDYVLKMRQLPQERLMNRLLSRGGIDKAVIDRIAKIMADFHRKAETSEEISAYGKPRKLRYNCEENFEKTEPFIGRVISRADFDHARKVMLGFIEANAAIFDRRVSGGLVRRIHGDMHSGNIFIIDGKPLIFDRIEFNMRFSCMDTAADVAFFSMDLDFNDRLDLSRYFVDRYIEYSGDGSLRHVLDFYKSYYAWVRGEVTALRLGEDMSKNELDDIEKTSRKYLGLALGYLRRMEK